MTNIVLCGGSGTRLWPLSRTLMPKQFIKIFDGQSLFQLTVERNAKVCDSFRIVTNTEHYFLAIDQLESIGQKGDCLLEPIGRNTAPAITLACLGLEADEVVLVTPSDHLIRDEETYAQVIEKAKKLADEGYMVTFGIEPCFAETGFGYIEADGFDVKAFHEKPDLQTAKSYLAQGNYYWNSGMFCFKAGVFLNELQTYAPEIYQTSVQAYSHADCKEMTRIKYEDMEQIPDMSIDYAVMEHSKCVKVIPSDIGWSDVGSFDALSEVLPNDEHNNLILSEKPVALIGITDSIVVDSGDVLMIVKKGRSQEVKQVVQRLEEEGSSLLTVHLTGYRPWGTYTILDENQGYKIKRIVVQPGKKLSLQKHYHRNEHWVVLSGSATVTIGERQFIVNPNESTYIKAGEVHRLENRGKLPLIIIEVQVGEYTGEDDIVRIEDDYARED